MEASLQYHFHIQPSEFKKMTDEDLVREWCKLQYILSLKDKSYNNLINTKRNR